ncbi:MAG: hypothetical protein M3139_02625 [Bacteroidota bacterium]|nr:hypothetical protein [Bacteroidota bacterium]
MIAINAKIERSIYILHESITSAIIASRLSGDSVQAFSLSPYCAMSFIISGSLFFARS